MNTEPYVCPACPDETVEVIEAGEIIRVPGFYGRLRFGDETMEPCPNCGTKLVPTVNSVDTPALTRAAA